MKQLYLILLLLMLLLTGCSKVKNTDGYSTNPNTKPSTSVNPTTFPTQQTKITTTNSINPISTVLPSKPDSFIKQTGNKSITHISLKDFDELIEEKIDFILLVHSSGCSSCERFITILEEYIETSETIVYALNLSDLSSTNKKDFNKTYNVRYTPSVIIFSKGQKYELIDPINNRQHFESTETITSYFENFTEKK